MAIIRAPLVNAIFSILNQYTNTFLFLDVWILYLEPFLHFTYHRHFHQQYYHPIKLSQTIDLSNEAILQPSPQEELSRRGNPLIDHFPLSRLVYGAVIDRPIRPPDFNLPARLTPRRSFRAPTSFCIPLLFFLSTSFLYLLAAKTAWQIIASRVAANAREWPALETREIASVGNRHRTPLIIMDPSRMNRCTGDKKPGELIVKFATLRCRFPVHFVG